MSERTAVLILVGIIAFCFAGCRTSSSFRSSLPPLSDGYHWEVFDEVSVAISSPDGWHRAVTKGNGTYTGSVSLEDFEKEGLFKTGFTVQVIEGVKQRTGRPASILAVHMGQEITDAPHNEVLTRDAMKDLGAVRSGFIRFRNSPALGSKITVHKFFVANDHADRLYIYTFESPNETWDHAFSKYGMPMMEQIVMTQ